MWTAESSPLVLSASDISVIIDLWSIAVEVGSGPAAFPKAWKVKLVLCLCCPGGRGLRSCSYVMWETGARKEIDRRPAQGELADLVPCVTGWAFPGGKKHCSYPPHLGTLKVGTLCQGFAKEVTAPQLPTAQRPSPKNPCKGKTRWEGATELLYAKRSPG